MREKLEMLLDELNTLKKEGVNSIYYEEASLDALKAAVNKSVGPKTEMPLSSSSTKVEETENPFSKIETESKAKAPVKKLNPFSPLPSDKEIPIVAETKISDNTKSMKSQPSAYPEVSPRIDLPKGDKQAQWEYLREKIANCPILKKDAKAGSKVVFGTGNLDADIFFCGDYPGFEEENEGTPFAGESGQLLTKIIQAMGLRRDAVYIANIMNWLLETPTHFGERTPTQLEISTSLPYLNAQIEIVKPKVIIALGATAVNGLLGPDKSRKMSDIRGQWFEFQNTPLMISFHPSYLIRNNTLRTKRLVWEDMLSVMGRLGMPISEKQRGFFK